MLPPRQPDDKTRLLVPVIAISLIAILGALDATLGRDPPARAHALEVSPVAVRIASESGGAPIRFGVEGPYRIFVGALEHPASAGEPLAAGPDLVDAVASLTSGAIHVNGEPLHPGPLTLIPDEDGTLEIEGRAYPGALILRSDKGRLRALNLVSLETYVAGVVRAEMPARFGTEALRAQSVIARTYALYHARRGRELRADQGFQVYRGLEGLDRDDLRIVDSTWGEILTWDGRPFETFFHSTCGGHTSSARGVFGMAVPPPLEAEREDPFCADSPYSSWTRTLEQSRVAELYHGAFGAALSFQVADRDDHGRALSVEILSADGEVADRSSADRFRNDANVGRPLSRRILSAFLTDVWAEGDLVTVRGRGFGHGVGLCQYGARGRAASGHSYREILLHYYPGASIQPCH